MPGQKWARNRTADSRPVPSLYFYPTAAEYQLPPCQLVPMCSVCPILAVMVFLNTVSSDLTMPCPLAWGPGSSVPSSLSLVR